MNTKRTILSNFRGQRLKFSDVVPKDESGSHETFDWEIIPFSWSDSNAGSLQNQAGAFLYHPDQDFAEFCSRVEGALGVTLDVVWIFLLELHELPRNLQGFSGLKVATISDWNLSYFNIRAAAPFFDLITADRRGTEVLQSLGVQAEYWNPYFYNEDRFASNTDSPETLWDISFIGRINPWIQRDRANFLRRLLRLSDKYKIRVASRIYGQEYVDTYRQSKIVFNRSIRGEANIRVFEAIAGESLVFLEESNQEVREFLAPGQECVLYNDADFEDRLVQLLENPTLLKQITTEATAKKDLYGARQGVRRLLQIIMAMLDDEKQKSLQHTIKSALSAQTQTKHSATEAEYRRLVHLLLTPRRIEKGRRYVQEIQDFLNQNPQPQYLGLWLLLIHFLLPREGISCQTAQGKQSLEHGREVWQYLKNKPEGQIFNTFNYARLLQRLKAPWQEEKAVWLKLLDLLGSVPQTFPPWEAPTIGEGKDDSASVPASVPAGVIQWLGVPFFQADAPYFLELNYYAWPWQTPPGCSGPRWKNYGLSAILQHIACMRLGEYAAMKQQNEEALDQLLKAGELYDRNSRTWHWTGVLSLGMSPIHAFKLLETSFLLDPFYMPVWELLLKTAVATGQKELFEQYKADMQRLETLAEQCYPGIGGDSWKGVVSSPKSL